MPKQDGFLTHFSIQKGWREKYNQLKWLWIGLSATTGLVAGLLAWFYNPQLAFPACVVGTFVGAVTFFFFLKSLKEKID